VPPETPLDAILWMIGKGEKDDLDESDKVLLRELCWVDNTTFLLPISAIGLVSGDKPVEVTKTTERGGESVVTVLKQFMTIQTNFNIFQVTINIIQDMNNINNEHQSHIRYTQRQIFTRKPIKGENLFFFE
jgi:hypothetical protein